VCKAAAENKLPAHFELVAAAVLYGNNILCVCKLELAGMSACGTSAGRRLI
jgi:hypothetical protein